MIRKGLAVLHQSEADPGWNEVERREQSSFVAYHFAKDRGFTRAASWTDLAADLDDGGQALIVYDWPISAIARALTESVPAESALRNWIEEAETALEYATTREGAVALCDRAVLIHPDIAAAIDHRFNGARQPISSRHHARDASDADLALATALLRCHDGVWPLIEALESRSIGKGRQRPEFADLLLRIRPKFDLTEQGDDLDEVLLAQLEDLREQLRHEATKTDNAWKEAEARHQALRTSYEAVLASTSWRLTRPLRQLIGWLRRD